MAAAVCVPVNLSDTVMLLVLLLRLHLLLLWPKGREQRKSTLNFSLFQEEHLFHPLLGVITAVYNAQPRVLFLSNAENTERYVTSNHLNFKNIYCNSRLVNDNGK